MKSINEQLFSIINGEPVGNSFPYEKGCGEEIEDYIKKLLFKLNESEQLECDGEFGHYGSGYASFI
ncbi:hypothetical protein RRU94_07100 [Domibacillus sp. DTU_2020_1001157_1_SI_ALB_TIR_016]|uniref:hypothetical protein n=1 Tax=Domibacillus sp. DTU_2020_1001157_1_SI_ALB_TIR_016 TaxID=3077789 RepID=UPI0028E988F1|nr:hypothetical protein [Domibacillus sp. DTU_2020_1001157_1_SI_ALB_TIR_016]WNS78221.1 hypothetical protein RRU94_07100 [Domibacillus sp. DTU_2020_1001157_1_SI_ALB_TIR_016]